MSDLVVSGGTVLAPGGPVAADVVVRGGRIDEVRPRPPGTGSRAGPDGGAGGGGGGGLLAERLDAGGLLVAPGLVDLQCNGAVGVDLAIEPEGLWTVAAALPGWGVTAWLPTIVSAPAEVRARALAAIRRGPPATVRGPLARPLGLHLEGPFLAPERAGAHARRHLRSPDPGLLSAEGWTVADGVAMVTLAPELPGALEVVRALAGRGVVVAAGHSSATAQQATAAVEAGVRFVTHLFNAMGPLHHREPGLAGVALSDDRLRVGVIADGVHLHPTTVAVAARALGDRLCLVSDAVAALGASAGGRGGEGGSGAGAGVGGPAAVAARATGGAARLADGTLAGSLTGLARAVRNLAAYAVVPPEAAVTAASATPAAVLGRADRGVCAPGAVGDVVVLDPGGGVVATVVGGEVAFDRRVAAGRGRGGERSG